MDREPGVWPPRVGRPAPAPSAKLATAIQEAPGVNLTVVGFAERLHNPAGQRCGCPPECICQRSPLGRAFRWYIPDGSTLLFHPGRRLD